MMTKAEFDEAAAVIQIAGFEEAHRIEDSLAMNILAGMALASNSRANFRKLQSLAIAWCALRHEQRPRWYA